ncbi:hypothetical protein [Novipirellula aureliae]|nr:hypothetical protein [Novipirellula aureliae]
MKEIPPELMDEISESIYQGRKLEAVKRYKELRGTSLLDAKNFIEALTEELKAASPERFSTQSTVGCASVLVLVLASLSVFCLIVISVAP